MSTTYSFNTITSIKREPTLTMGIMEDMAFGLVVLLTVRLQLVVRDTTSRVLFPNIFFLPTRKCLAFLCSTTWFMTHREWKVLFTENLLGFGNRPPPQVLVCACFMECLPVLWLTMCFSIVLEVKGNVALLAIPRNNKNQIRGQMETYALIVIGASLYVFPFVFPFPN